MQLEDLIFLFVLFCRELILFEGSQCWREGSVTQMLRVPANTTVSTGFHGFSENSSNHSGLDEFSTIQAPFSLYSTYSEAELRAGCSFHWEFYSSAQNELCDVCPCRLIHCAQKPGEGKPLDLSISSVCIELHIKQISQQTHRGKNSY